MLNHLQKWLSSARHAQAAKVASRPLALEVLELRTVFSATPLAPVAFLVEPASSAEGPAEVRFFEVESTWLVVRSIPDGGEEARPELPHRDVSEPARKPLPIGEGEAPSAERTPVNLFVRLELRPSSPEGESFPGSAPLVETVLRPAAIAPAPARANVEPGATSLLAQWNPPAATVRRENVLDNSATSPAANGGEKGRLASAANHQPGAITAGNPAKENADLAKSSRRLSESAVSEEGGFIELDSLWNDARRKRQGGLSSSRPFVESERGVKRSNSDTRATVDLWRGLPPLTGDESLGRGRAEFVDETRLPGSGKPTALPRAAKEGGQIELPAVAGALPTGSVRHSANVPVPIRDRENKLDVGIGLYQAVELALVPGENPTHGAAAIEDAAAIDSTTLLDALSQLLNVENVAEFFQTPAGD